MRTSRSASPQPVSATARVPIPVLSAARKFQRRAGLLLGLMATAAVSHAQLVFNMNSTGNAQADAGFAAGGAMWSALFDDNVTVNLNIGFNALGPGILASAGSTQAFYSYGSVRNALIADATSLFDQTATANLQAGSLSLLINRTSNNPNGAGSATPYLDNDGDANNTTIRLSNANAKALGLLGAHNVAIDANITFSSAFAWDFDPSNGITAGTYDFVGIAAHEIGHALGFISGVDILDINSPPVNGPFFDNQFTFVSALDLYRYSALSDASGALDWTADTRTKYFSIDGGTTSLATFSTGVNFGDGRQASHWKDNLGLGILDPTAAQGELLAVTANDVLAFDVIGWDLNIVSPPAVPDASSSLLLIGLGLGSLLTVRRRFSGRTS